ncbi:MAG: cytochrome c3 family protein [Anaerolineales bacterium]|nr:MAG: cytochrome c3 family protein [Anaerolineales bacterium]
MKNNRLGCLTGTGIIAAFITIFVLVGVAFASGGQMFSSGALNDQQGRELGGVTSHAQIQECGACHVPFWGRESMADRCIKCHTEIAAQMLTVAELHGIITHKSPALACRDCHPEHRGKTASLTELGKNEFPHDTFGYSLEGHQRNLNGTSFECADCHGDDIATFASDSCLTCHREVDLVYAQTHLLEFGADCLVCHDGIDTYGDDFDHNRFGFPLQGKHSGLPCSQCHLDARSISDMQLTLQDCYSCHRADDPHEFAYGAECQACHSPNGWTPATFDHNLSAFKLDGAHANVECESCHKNGVYKGTPKECVACHAEPSEHFGQFGTECGVCHSTSAWEPASYNGPHTFPMNHEGADNQCALCHPNSLTTYTCYGCHEHNPSEIASEHREEGIFNFENCVECHASGQKEEGEGDDD